MKYEGSIGALSIFIDELQDEKLQSMSIYTGRQFVWRHFQKVLVISSIVICRTLDSGVDEFRTISVPQSRKTLMLPECTSMVLESITGDPLDYLN